jgi:hypothetical protein
MAVPMVDVRVVGVAVEDRIVTMLVRVGLVLVRAGGVRVPVVLVVNVAVAVHQGVVDVLVLVALGEMQPGARGHQQTRQQEGRRDRLPEQDHGRRRADERREREVGPRARGAEVSQRDHEEGQAQAVGHEADYERGG